jgi:hypothetical protein
MKLTNEEKGFLSIIRLNKLWPKPKTDEWLVNKRIYIGFYEIHIEKKSKKELWGRFGGGWNWIVGIEIGGKSIIINWLVGTIRISKRGLS